MIEVDGLRFHCQLDGRPDAPWLVFSNSLLTNLALWDAQVAALAQRFRILRYDQRGHGRTALPPGPATIAQLADDVAGLCAHFEIRHATFIGISLGGITGLSLASRHPGLLTKLIVCDAQAKAPPSLDFHGADLT